MEYVRFQVLTAASMKIAVFWIVAPCSLVEVYQRFRGAIAMMMEAASISKTSVNFYQTTRRSNPEDSHLLTRRRENLKSYVFIIFPTRNTGLCPPPPNLPLFDNSNTIW
jgi:hypothetical protein